MAELNRRKSPFSQEDLILREAEAMDRARQVLERIVSELGYATAAQFGDLDLTKEQIGMLYYYRASRPHPGARFYQTRRQDGDAVKAIIQPVRGECFSADIFFPAFFKGHAHNHDFSKGELEGILKLALSGERYPSRKS